MSSGLRQLSGWKPLLELAYAVLGLTFLLVGVASSDWLKVVGGAFILVSGAGQLWSRSRPTPVSAGLSADEARAEVLAVAGSGDRVKAVKVLRDRTGLGLREATETVRRWLEEEGNPWH